MQSKFPIGLPDAMLGPIGKCARGQRLHDVAEQKDGVLLRCISGREIDIQWGDRGPELRAVREGVITSEVQLPPDYAKRLRGKRIDSTQGMGGNFAIVCEDGHVLQYRWGKSGPVAGGVEVRLHCELPWEVAEPKRRRN